MAASATFALKSGEWFRRVRFVIFAPDSHAQPCALSGRDSTHRTDRNSGATSVLTGQRTGFFDSVPADDLPVSKDFEDRAFSSSIHKHAPHRFRLTFGESTEDHVFWSQVASCQSCSQIGQALVGPELLSEFLDLESYFFFCWR